MNDVFLSSTSLNFKPFPQSGSENPDRIEIQNAKKIIFKKRNGHADFGERGAHRQPHAGWTVLLLIQTEPFGEPPKPSASDLTLALDQY